MVQSRLRPRLKVLGLSSISEYLNFVSSGVGNEELKNMISALTTNVSHFFREAHHFDFLRDHLSEKLEAETKQGQRVRVWSAGCSNGQEAVSIAISLLRQMPSISSHDVRILATDIDRDVLKFAIVGEYPERMMSGVSNEDLARYFRITDSNGSLSYQVSQEIRDLIVFKELNLLSSWPMKNYFDVIFCRNVVIYFDAATQNALWPRFHKMLAPSGLFCLGHSERMAEPDRMGFEAIGPTAYRKKSTGVTELEVENGTA